MAAEEIAKTAVDPALNETLEKINDVQINFIDTMCKRLKINVEKFVNNQLDSVDNIKEVTHAESQDLNQTLAAYQRGANDGGEDISDDIKGYDANWRTKFEKGTK